jgi:RNA recognition motif-containing protein
MPTAMVPTTSWSLPSLLPERPDVPPANLVSQELVVQSERVRTTPAAQYSSDYDIPANPAPLSDVEQALDMTSQSSAVITSMPFFAPEAVVVPVVEAVLPAYDPTPAYSYAPVQDLGASPAFVQSLGLPMFLAGQNVQALQTLASSPGLLATFVDSYGGYDQQRLLTLVQTLSGTSISQSPPASMYQTPNGMYGVPAAMPAYGQTSTFQNPVTTAYRSSSSSGEGNLHVSGYGPATTQSDIIAMFSPYVQVNEVVMKGTFSFVNTNDTVNAHLAREALNGTLLGGMPVRINAAQRKARESTISAYGPTSSGPTFSGVAYSASSNPVGAGAAPPPFGMPMPPSFGGSIPSAPVLPTVNTTAIMGQVNVDSVRDDRGNAATKNLFVAGYGQGTTEEDVRMLFSQHSNVIGVVIKGSFAFVNTSDRAMAVAARQALGGTMFNGGVLRINFAKETGRLGTSFDLTYGRNTGPNAAPHRKAPAADPMSHYGRGY